MITVERTPATEEAFREVAAFGMAGLREYLVAPINPEKAAAQCYLTIQEGMMFVARNETGELVGCLGMMTADFWYSDQPVLLSRIGPYIRPDQRWGTAGIKLLRAVKSLADEMDRLAFVWVARPGRQRSSDAALFASVAGYVPLGMVAQIRAKHRVAEPA